MNSEGHMKCYGKVTSLEYFFFTKEVSNENNSSPFISDKHDLGNSYLCNLPQMLQPAALPWYIHFGAQEPQTCTMLQQYVQSRRTSSWCMVSVSSTEEQPPCRIQETQYLFYSVAYIYLAEFPSSTEVSAHQSSPDSTKMAAQLHVICIRT